MSDKIEIGTTIDEPAQGQRAVQRRTAVWQIDRRTCDQILKDTQKALNELGNLKALIVKADELGFWTEGERAALEKVGMLNGKPQPATQESETE